MEAQPWIGVGWGWGGGGLLLLLKYHLAPPPPSETGRYSEQNVRVALFVLLDGTQCDIIPAWPKQ